MIYRQGTCDEKVVASVTAGEYDVFKHCRKRVQELKTFYASLKHPFILDLGAHIGVSCVWFSNEFPEAEVLGVEPEAENFGLLMQNHANCLQAAVASYGGTTRLKLRDESWQHRTGLEFDGPEVKTVTVPQLLRGDPWVVKVDIEGAEKELFSANVDWVQSIPVLMVELHDWMLPKQGTSLPLLKLLSSLDRDFVYSGETVFSVKNDLY